MYFGADMKEDRAIVFHCNRDYIFALGSMICNLEERSVSYDRIIVYTNFHDDSIFRKFIDINEKIEFIYYPLDDFIKEFNIDITNRNIKNYIERYTHLCYIKLKIFEMLARYRHVLFMDLDMYVAGNFDELFDLDCDIAWRCGVTLLTKFGKSNLDIGNVPYLKDADTTTSAPNGGFILVNHSLAHEDIYQFSKEFFCKYVGFFNSTIDEIVFSVAVLCKNLRLIKLDQQIYNTPLQLFTEKAKIIHFIGRETKPWSNILFQRLFPGWLENYRRFARKTHFVSDKIRDSEAMEFSSCRMELTYGDTQKYGITYQICPDHSVKCFLTFNAEKYLFEREIVHNFNQILCRGVREQGEAARSGMLSPEELLPLFEYLHERLGNAALRDPQDGKESAR
jgi:lipopolysaccharide biosynthesis glycosyltransferase